MEYSFRRSTEFKKVAEEEKGPAFKTLLKGIGIYVDSQRRSEN